MSGGSRTAGPAMRGGATPVGGTAREDVLAAVRRALGGTADGTAPSADAAAPVPRTYRAATGVAGASSDLDVLVDRLLDYRASVRRCVADDLPGVVVEELAGVGTVVVPPGLDPAWLPALRQAGVTVLVDEPDAPLAQSALDATGAALTACRVAVAETGTLVLDGAPDQGRRVLTLLPDRHVCVVRAEQVVPGVPDAVALLSEHPERPLTWISGPSATSDIELVRVEGVHGPRDLRVVVVEAERRPGKA